MNINSVTKMLAAAAVMSLGAASAYAHSNETTASIANNPGAGTSPSIPAPTIEEFEVRGLVIPQGNVVL